MIYGNHGIRISMSVILIVIFFMIFDLKYMYMLSGVRNLDKFVFTYIVPQ